MKRESIVIWAERLNEEQLREAVVNAVTHLCETDDVHIGDLGVPYWESCGEPLVAGQETWSED